MSAIRIRERAFRVRCAILTGFLILLLGCPLIMIAKSYPYPRISAMGGAFTAVPQGFFSVGHNPANLGFEGEYRNYFYLAGFNYFMSNNFFSLKTSARYGGKDLTRDDGQLQQDFIDELPEKGWRTSYGLDVPLPIINFSLGNKAFTTNFLYHSDYYVSRPALDVIFGNWEKGVEYECDLRAEAMTAIEYTYSMGIPYEKLSVGFSIKYIQGLAYFGLDPERSSGLIAVDTDSFQLNGSGDYFLRQSDGGKGFGFNLGVSYQDESGWRFGFGALNLASLIRWNSPTLLSGLGEGVLKFMGNQVKTGLIKNSDLDLDFEGESYEYVFELRNVNADEFFEGDTGYGYYFHSQKTVTPEDSTAFQTRLPLVLQFGVARQLNDDLLLALDFSSSFNDRLTYWKGWRIGLGMEYSYLPKTPLRLGMAFGGLTGWEIDLGSGFHLGFVHLDWAVGFHRGLWLHTAKGIQFSVASYFTGKGK